LIRDAIKTHPNMGNTELAEMINNSSARDEDKLQVKTQDVGFLTTVRKALKTKANPRKLCLVAAAGGRLRNTITSTRV